MRGQSAWRSTQPPARSLLGQEGRQRLRSPALPAQVASHTVCPVSVLFSTNPCAFSSALGIPVLTKDGQESVDLGLKYGDSVSRTLLRECLQCKLDVWAQNSPEGTEVQKRLFLPAPLWGAARSHPEPRPRRRTHTWTPPPQRAYLHLLGKGALSQQPCL